MCSTQIDIDNIAGLSTCLRLHILNMAETYTWFQLLGEEPSTVGNPLLVAEHSADKRALAELTKCSKRAYRKKKGDRGGGANNNAQCGTLERWDSAAGVECRRGAQQDDTPFAYQLHLSTS